MRTNLLLFLSGAMLLQISCVNMERSHESGYAQASTKSTESGWKKVAKSEDYHRKEEAPPADAKIRLKQLENKVDGRRELEQYSKALPWFKDDAEKIQFLELDGYEPRQQWLSSQDFVARAKKVATQMQDIVEAQDIALGMPENLVKKSWGEPAEVEVSGSPAFHNQRWRYHKFVSSSDGYKSERKTVYFESGKVVGWETE